MRDQFDDHLVSGLIILDRAYVHPALRGHHLGVWAVVQANDDLTMARTCWLSPTPPRSSVASWVMGLAPRPRKQGNEAGQRSA